VVDAPLKKVWEVAEDITLIPQYHPEVGQVDLIAGQAKRSLGARYQCDILEGRRAGSCVEEVVAYEPERMLATRMVSDTWGIDRMLADFRVETSVSRRSETSTILKFEAFYEPVGVKYRLLNALFLRRAIRRRSLAVMNGIKRFIEAHAEQAPGTPRPQPNAHASGDGPDRRAKLVEEMLTRLEAVKEPSQQTGPG
jgi:Polyketide cyclase / dehydrase and lipid transport